MSHQQEGIRKYAIFFLLAIASFMALIATFTAVYTVEEGHVGIVKRFGKAIEQVGPGIHAKIPFVDSVAEIEVRTRRNVESLPAATSEQMAVTTTVSINWTVNKESALTLYQNYGSLQQFEERVLDSRLRSAAKTAISKYKAEQIIQDRGAVINDIELTITEEMAGFPVKLDSAQLENVDLPDTYRKSIETKQTEKNLADAERHKLERQRLEAQQKVNTAEAERDAAKAAADGKAYAILEEAKATAQATEMQGLAEASAIKAKTEAMKGNPILVDYVRAERWNGQMPTMVVGSESQQIMWQLVQPKQPETPNMH